MITKYKEIDEHYIPLSAEKLIVGTRLPFNVFIKDKGFIKPLFDKEMIFTNIAKNILKEKRHI